MFFAFLAVYFRATNLLITTFWGVPEDGEEGQCADQVEILNQIAKEAKLTRKEVSAVLSSLNGVIRKSLRANSQFTLPRLLKLKVVKKPAKGPQVPTPSPARR